MKIAALNKSFRLPFGETLRLANMMGFDSLQLALEGEFDVDSMSHEKTAVVSKMLDEYGIKISSYCGDLGGHGFTDAGLNKYKITKTLRMIDYAHNTGVPIITIPIGVIPNDRFSKCYSVISKAICTVGEYAAKCGITVAAQTGSTNPRVLVDFIDCMPGSIRLSVNPANLAMSMGVDPAWAVGVLGNRIIHTNATDGKSIQPANSVCGVLDGCYDTPFFTECAIGTGEVDWDGYLSALKSIDYKGLLTIECNRCDDPLTAIAEGKSLLSQKLAGQ